MFCGSEEVRLGGRATDVLLALVRKKGEVVTKEELLAAAWPDIAVHESNLKVTVASLRRALREHSPGHEFITTVVGLRIRDELPPRHAGAPRLLSIKHRSASSAC